MIEVLLMLKLLLMRLMLLVIVGGRWIKASSASLMYIHRFS